MGLASHYQVLLVFISITTCILSNFKLVAATSLPEQNSVSGSITTKTGLEFLYGKDGQVEQNSNSRRQAQEGEAVDKWGHGTKTIVVAGLIGATLLLVFAATTAVLCLVRRIQCKRSQKHRTVVPTRAPDKVSFDTGPELFYLNSLSQFQDNKSTLHKMNESRNVLLKPMKYETLPCSAYPVFSVSESNVSHSSSSSSFSPFSSSDRSMSPDSQSIALDLEKHCTIMSSCVDVIEEESHSPSVPLFNGGNGRTPKPPPPLPPLPPGRLQQCKPLGKDGSPLPKLKPLHWDKVRPASNHSTVWDNIRSKSFEFDEEMIKHLFGYDSKGLTKNEDMSTKNQAPTMHILELKRLQNITILLKALNATTDEVHDALVQGGGLWAEQLEVLLKVMPTRVEEKKLASYIGDINDLSSAEQFLKAMLEIPFAFSRIEIMLYKENFEEDVCHLKETFRIVEEACMELRTSQHFLKLLKTVLKAGNRMNVGTIRGGATAFKLDCLLKLADVKGIDGKTTLLHFVVQEMIRSDDKEEDGGSQTMALDLVSILNSELRSVKRAANLDLDDLSSSVLTLSNGMNHLKHLLQEDLSMCDNNECGFVNSMKPFLDHAETVMKELKDDEEHVLIGVKEITQYYHGDVNKNEANSLRIFVIVRDFLEVLDRECIR
ncbi:hypothetical protein J5N97_005552 [Dioscorea zingiberensis]|uniref:Formin-like protein n=1 Tax=Dioscorea zingiberensis TaxID=325984 RepID=A0A9D5HSS5_9LILI|nr:hypothetical protein J5N97_005552 [Dioscorea zingiberensis]